MRLSFFKFLKYFYIITDEMFTTENGWRRITKKWRKLLILFCYIILIFSIIMLFIYSFSRFFFIFLLLSVIYLEFILNFSIIRMLIIYVFIYSKNNTITRIFHEIYYNNDIDILKKMFNGIVKQISIGKDYFNICKIDVGGFLNNKYIKIRFKKYKIIISYKKEKIVINKIESSLDNFIICIRQMLLNIR